jgi:excinuclease ABC subunit C
LYTEIALKLENIPNRPGVYLMKDENGAVLYVGKALSLRSRVRSYFQAGQKHSPRIAAMVKRVRDLDYIVTDSEVEALILECTLIKEHRPRYNVSLKDDKSYPYLKITNEPYPRLFFTRQPEKVDGRYFGPYTNVGAVRETIKFLKRLFPLRSCRQPLKGEPWGRPCLNFQMKRCLAPCRGAKAVSPEEYGQLVERLALYLEGKQGDLPQRLQSEMEEAAANLEFERAARLRDQLHSLQQLSARQKMIADDEGDRDILALVRDEKTANVQLFQVRGGKLTGQDFFLLSNTEDVDDAEAMSAFLKSYYHQAAIVPREILLSVEPQEKKLLQSWLRKRRGGSVTLKQPQRGSKRELLELALRNARLQVEERRCRQENSSSDAALVELARLLGTEELPQRIEGYDISHCSGEETVGSMVVFIGGEPSKANYRRFRIKTLEAIDDYAALQEVLRRRLERKELPLPDLMLIDGGRGQLSSAYRVLQEKRMEHLPLLSLAKEREHIFLVGQEAPLVLPAQNPALKLLQHLRDEAHRFAVSYHRERRQKSAFRSFLESVPGIGPKRRRSLLSHFGSIEEIYNSTEEQLSSVAGMNRRVARTLYQYLHGEEK